MMTPAQENKIDRVLLALESPPAAEAPVKPSPESPRRVPPSWKYTIGILVGLATLFAIAWGASAVASDFAQKAELQTHIGKAGHPLGLQRLEQAEGKIEVVAEDVKALGKSITTVQRGVERLQDRWGILVPDDEKLKPKE